MRDADRPVVAETARHAHDAAVERREPGYVDPDTGLSVFTELGLLARGSCCEAGCRHCPYGDV